MKVLADLSDWLLDTGWAPMPISQMAPLPPLD
jgi:hypothetical protein